MNTSLEVVDKDIQPASLMTVIERLASNPNVDIDKLRQLLEMQERWELNRDKSTLRHAMAEFKKNPPEIIKNRKAVMEKDGRKLYEYNYSDLENVTSAVEIGMAERGVTFAWPQREDDKGLITVTCVMRLGMYEEEGVSMSAPPDTSGGKNAIQAKASTVSYLRRYTLLGAVGMAAGMPDKDGAGSEPPKGSRLKDEIVGSSLDDIENCRDLVELQRVHNRVCKMAQEADDKGAELSFIKASNARKVAIRGGAA